MISKTKFLLDDDTIKRLFAKANITNITAISPLGAGEYNAVYEVLADKPYVLKIAPKDGTKVLTYEKSMLKTEVYWYDIIRRETNINVPEIYYADFSREIIPAEWFIMEKIEGKTLSEFKMTADERKNADSKTAEMAAQIHKIHNEKFGYIQNELHDNWYLALRSMTQNLIDDAEKMGKNSPRGKKLLSYIDKHRDVFEKVDCSMVNFDINTANIMCERVDGKIKYTWIDPERSLWGDRILDFCLLDMMVPLEKKKSVTAYNKIAEKPINASREEKIRYAAANGLLALIMEVEKYYRYTKTNFGWWRNVFACVALYAIAFKGLKNG